jgi:hypothetical protein
MEAQDSNYRKAMVHMRKLLPDDEPPKVCVKCVAWEHFGGTKAKDVTMGPMCICDKNWKSVQKYISIMKSKKLLVI